MGVNPYSRFLGKMFRLTAKERKLMRINAQMKVMAVTVGLAALVGCSHDPNRSAGRALDDRLVSSKVNSGLKDSPVYKFPQVRVSTYNGIVQLSGFVHSDQQKSEAAQVAKNVPGVAQVINNISVLPPEAIGSTHPPTTRTSGSDTNSTYRTSEPDIRK
jgi:hyperosmotically inducible periplasmic protein